jgi:bacteriorhodopsin
MPLSSLRMRSSLSEQPNDGPNHRAQIAWLSILAWLTYPIVFLFSEEFAFISVSCEVCAYADLEIFAKVVLSFIVPMTPWACRVRAADGPAIGPPIRLIPSQCADGDCDAGP